MKSLKFLTMGAAALTFASAASAQTYVYLTGSTAYRGETTRAIAKALGATVGVGDTTFTIPVVNGVGGYVWESGSGAANVTKSDAQIFEGYTGGTSSGTHVIIKTSWSGSDAGIQTVAGNGFTAKYLPDTGTGAYTIPTNGGALSAGVQDPTASTGTPPSVSVAPNFCMSDNTQASAPFNGTFQGHTYAALVDAQSSPVGIVPFVWVASDVSNSALASGDKTKVLAGLTNMTPQLAQALWTTTGTLPLSLFSGSAADSGIQVYATGRDPDSGTRTTAFAESGIGIFSTVQQYDAGLDTGGAASLYAAETINGISLDDGQGGESSGGKLAGTTKMGKDGLGNVYVSYLSTGDAGTLVGNGGYILKYNGVSESNATVQNGQYTFWGYEHLFYRSTLSGVPKTVADSIASLIHGTYSTLQISSMFVSRQTDGGLVTP